MAALTKQKVLTAFKWQSQELAAKLKVDKSTVSRWPDNGPIPEKYQFRLSKHPELQHIDWDEIAAKRA